MAQLTCLRCSYSWNARKDGTPKKCPKCSSYDWNKPGAGSITQTLHCKQCGHQWSTKVSNPKACPKCKSYNWNKDKLPRASSICLSCTCFVDGACDRGKKGPDKRNRCDGYFKKLTLVLGSQEDLDFDF
jgi:hypothetical protein